MKVFPLGRLSRPDSILPGCAAVWNRLSLRSSKLCCRTPTERPPDRATRIEVPHVGMQACPFGRVALPAPIPSYKAVQQCGPVYHFEARSCVAVRRHDVLAEFHVMDEVLPDYFLKVLPA